MRTVEALAQALLAELHDGVITVAELEEMNDCCDGLDRRERAALGRVLDQARAEVVA